MLGLPFGTQWRKMLDWLLWIIVGSCTRLHNDYDPLLPMFSRIRNKNPQTFMVVDELNLTTHHKTRLLGGWVPRRLYYSTKEVGGVQKEYIGKRDPNSKKNLQILCQLWELSLRSSGGGCNVYYIVQPLLALKYTSSPSMPLMTQLWRVNVT